MKRCIRASIFTAFLTTIFAWAAFAQQGQLNPNVAIGSSADYFQALKGTISGDWQEYGQLFTTLQKEWFWKVFLAIIVGIPALFFLHYLIVGAKKFDHDGPQVHFFSRFARIVHFWAAVSFSLLVVTGLMMTFGAYLGGGKLILNARYLHLISAIIFIIPGTLMFLMWLKDMFPQLHDIKWLFIMGGYLSKDKKPVPAAKFNCGQKIYFWFTTLGGALMAFSGYVIWGMAGTIDNVRLYTIIHNVLGMTIVAFYITHLYMVVFAISGALNSMKTGYKPKDEVDTLHSLYKYK